MARAFFDLLQAELYLRSMRLQHHVRCSITSVSHAVTVPVLPCSHSPPSLLIFLLSLPQALGETSTAISPKALSLLVSHLLYFKFRGSGTAPIIAGLDQDGTSVLCTQGGEKKTRRARNAGDLGRIGMRDGMDALTPK